MPQTDKLNALFQSALGACLPGLRVCLLACIIPALPVTAPAQAPIDLSGELSNSGNTSSLARILDWLRAAGDPDTVMDSDGNTFMHYAAVNRLDILQEAVRRGGDCNRRNDYGATPLHFAAAQNVTLGPGAEAIRVLARCEANRDVSGDCARDGRADQCRADPNARDRRGNTPLHTVYEGLEKVPAATGNVAITPNAEADILLALLQVEADPNLRNGKGDVPLMPAIRYGLPMFTKPGHVSQLLRHGADSNTQNNRGATPLIETVSLPVNAKRADDDPVQIIVDLLRHRADPDLRAGNGDTPLIRAARHEDDSVFEIEALLAGGADPCLRDRNGKLAYEHTGEYSEGRQALHDAGGYPDRETGLCVRELQDAEAREKQLGLDQDTRRHIRSCLKTAGFDPGADDGAFGPPTRAAVRAWQQAQGREGIEAAGYFAEGEADSLLEACSAASPVVVAEPECRDLIDINASMFPARMELARLDEMKGTGEYYMTLIDLQDQFYSEWGDQFQSGVRSSRLELSQEFQQKSGLVLEMCWVEVSNVPGCHAFIGPLDETAGPGGKTVYMSGADGFRLYPLSYEWSGECKNGVVNGKGVVRVKNFRGSPYEFERTFKEGKRQGEGKDSLLAGCYLSGKYENGLRHGKWTVSCDSDYDYDYHGYSRNFRDEVYERYKDINIAYKEGDAIECSGLVVDASVYGLSSLRDSCP